MGKGLSKSKNFERRDDEKLFPFLEESGTRAKQFCLFGQMLRSEGEEIFLEISEELWRLSH